MATFAIDPAHTDVLFSAKHLMVTNVRGTFTDVAGTIELDEADPTASHAEITVQAASVDSGFGARDAHLRSDDFFATERVSRDQGRLDRDHAQGRQRLRRDRRRDRQGRHPVGRLRCRVPRLLPGMDGARRAGFTATAKIDRKALGPRLERRSRSGRLAGRRPDQARHRPRATAGRGSRASGLSDAAAHPAPRPNARKRHGSPWRFFASSWRRELVDRPAAIDEVQLARLDPHRTS